MGKGISSTRSLGALVRDAINYEIWVRFPEINNVSPLMRKEYQARLDSLYAELDKRDSELVSRQDVAWGRLQVSVKDEGGGSS
jgi:hypothetical protein